MRTNFIKEIKEKVMRTKFIKEKFMKKTIGVFAVSAVLVMLGLMLTCENTLYKNEAKKAAPKTEEKETGGGYYTPPTVLPTTTIYKKVIKGTSDAGEVVLTLSTTTPPTTKSVNTSQNASGVMFDIVSPKKDDEFDYTLAVDGETISSGKVTVKEDNTTWKFIPDVEYTPSNVFDVAYSFTAKLSDGNLAFLDPIPTGKTETGENGVENPVYISIDELDVEGGLWLGNGDDSNNEEEDEELEEEIKVISLTLNKTTLELEKGETFTLEATIETEPAGENVEIHWNSNKPIIASVENGVITAKKGGEATIWVKAGSKTASCKVTVPLDAGLYIGESSDAEDLSQTEGETLLTKALAWINANGVPEGQYTILLGADETDATADGYEIKGASDKKNMVITLRGMSSDAENPVTITKNAAGPLFTVYGSATGDDDVPELVLENITLKGYASNTSALVVVGKLYGGTYYYKGKLTMREGSRITGNTTSAGAGGVSVLNGSLFAMKDGRIDNNTATGASGVGGVSVLGSFTMEGGRIDDNKVITTAANINGYGGGVTNGGTFIMRGGNIEENIVGSTAHRNAMGAGVYNTSGTFEMSGGTIRNNECFVLSTRQTGRGGGVYITGGTFTMPGGSIESNSAVDGAAIYVLSGAYIKSGGTVYGKEEEAGDKANVPTTSANHVIYVSNTRWRDTTAGPEVALDSTQAENWGTP